MVDDTQRGGKRKAMGTTSPTEKLRVSLDAPAAQAHAAGDLRRDVADDVTVQVQRHDDVKLLGAVRQQRRADVLRA